MKTVLSQEISYQDASLYAEALSSDPEFLWLDSVTCVKGLGHRYSYLAWDPVETHVAEKQDAKTFKALLNRVQMDFSLKKIPGLPPFQTGLAGYLSYETGSFFEPVPSDYQKGDWPFYVLNLYDLVLGLDHDAKKAWLMSSGLPETEEVRRCKRAQMRLEVALDRLGSKKISKPQEKLQTNTVFQPVLSKQDYLQKVQKAQAHIRAGDIFEVNLAQPFHADFKGSGFAWYTHLREKNAAPMAAYFKSEYGEILSTSPERFLSLEGQHLKAYPIKGTAARRKEASKDFLQGRALQESEKDRAENIMIVDLMRNDFSKICEDLSVMVSALCALFSFPAVHHLISVIEGVVSKEITWFDILKATFPAGSITGAPKVRSMKVINTLEDHSRGPYCGSLLFASLTGDLDSSVLIRSVFLKEGKATLWSGGAITLDSSPEDEWQETRDKIAKLTELDA